MAKSKQRIFSAVLAALMAVSVTACSHSTGGGTSSAANSAVPSGNGQNAMEDKSPVTLTMCTTKGNGVDNGPWTSAVGKEITRQTGVTLDMVVVDKDKLKVLASGGDLPDLVYLTELKMADTKSMITSGQLLAVDDLLNKYGQNLLKNEPVALKWSKEILGEGKTYIIPSAVKKADKENPQGNAFVGFFSRYDIYKAIGSPKMNGEDDYLNVLKKMQDYAQGKMPAGKKVYALSAWTDWSLWPYYILYPFSFGYTNLNENMLGNEETEELESQFMTEDGIFWKAVKFYNKAYRMGIFDPEGLTQKYEQYTNKIKSGLVLTSAFGQDVPQCGDKAITTLLPGAFPILPDIYNYDLAVGYNVTDSRAISVNCKHPERAMQLMNFFDSEEGARLIINGVKGTDWDVKDGKPQIIGERLKKIQSGSSSEYDMKNGIGVLTYFYSGAVTPADGAPTVLSGSKDFMVQNATKAQKAFAQDFNKNFSFPGQVYDAWVKDGTAKTITTVPISLQIMGSCSDSTEQIESNAEQYVSANISKIIMAKDDAAFDSAKASAISALKAMGMDKANEEVMKNYETAKKQAESFK